MQQVPKPGHGRHGLVARVRYHVDNALTRSHSFALFIFAATLVLAMAMTTVQSFIAGIAVLTAPADPEASTLDAFWSSFARILALNQQPTWAERIVATLYWAIGITVTGTVIGFITSRMQGAITALRQGRSPIVQSGHILVLGWSPRITALIEELAEASRNVNRTTVVIFADRDREWMLQEVESQVTDLGRVRLVTRRGDPTNPRDLARANVGCARCVIILDSDVSGDAAAVTTVLAACAVAPAAEVPIIVEIDDASTASALVASMRGRVRPVRSQELIARVTAQASRQAGLGAVMLDLLNFSGEEIYFSPAPTLEGRPYAEIQRCFAEACPIGWLEPDGTPHLNPPADARLPSPGRVIAIAADDDRVVPLPSPIEPRTLETERSPGPLQAPERILVVGWSCMGRAVFRSLAPFLPPGSRVLVAARPDLQGEWQPSELEALGLSVRHVDLSGDVGVLTRIVSEEHFDEIIVLGYRQHIGPSEADAQTMLTLMLLGDLVAKGDRSLAGTRIVGEILDSRRVDLARRARADDLVVSDRLAGSMIAQLAENPQLAPVFEDLFDADGATVTLRRIGLYANPGQEVTFGDLVHMAALRGDSAIGYRSARAAGGSGDAVVRLNPAKSDRFQVEPEDSLVVIGPLR